jgi:hypothetical protein
MFGLDHGLPVEAGDQAEWSPPGQAANTWELPRAIDRLEAAISDDATTEATVEALHRSPGNRSESRNGLSSVRYALQRRRVYHEVTYNEMYGDTGLIVERLLSASAARLFFAERIAALPRK